MFFVDYHLDQVIDLSQLRSFEKDKYNVILFCTSDPNDPNDAQEFYFEVKLDSDDYLTILTITPSKQWEQYYTTFEVNRNISRTEIFSVRIRNGTESNKSANFFRHVVLNHVEGGPETIITHSSILENYDFRFPLETNYVRHDWITNNNVYHEFDTTNHKYEYEWVEQLIGEKYYISLLQGSDITQDILFENTYFIDTSDQYIYDYNFNYPSVGEYVMTTFTRLGRKLEKEMDISFQGNHRARFIDYPFTSINFYPQISNKTVGDAKNFFKLTQQTFTSIDHPPSDTVFMHLINNNLSGTNATNTDSDPIIHFFALTPKEDTNGNFLSVNLLENDHQVHLLDFQNFSDSLLYSRTYLLSDAPEVSYLTTTVPITINRIPQDPPLTFSTISVQSYDELYKDISLSVTGGSPYAGDISFYGPNVIHSNGYDYLRYSDIGFYKVFSTKFGGSNYLDEDISLIIQVLPDSANIIEGTISYVYDPTNKTINLSSIYQGDEDTSFYFSGSEVNGDILTYTNIGSYAIYVTASSTNFDSITLNKIVNITQATQDSIDITTENSFLFDPRTQDIFLSVSGGAEECNTSYSVDGAPLTSSIFTYNSVGSYTIIATSSGINYFDITDSITITIDKGYQLPFEFLNNENYIYNENNKIIQLETIGGSGSGSVSYSYYDETLNSSQFTYVNVGSYPFIATRFGDTNFLDTSDAITINIIKAKQSQLVLDLKSTEYSSSDKNVTLNVIGGSGTGSYDLSGFGVTSDENSNFTFSYTTAGSYTFILTKDGDTNHHKKTNTDTFIVQTVTQDVILQTEANYTPRLTDNVIDFFNINGLVFDTIEYKIENNSVIGHQNVLHFTKPTELFSIEVSIEGINNASIIKTIDFVVKKTPVDILRTNGFIVKEIKADPYYDIYEIATSYTLMEIINGGYTLEEIYKVWKKLQLEKHNLCSVYNTKLYTIKQLQNVGYRMSFCIR